jgi:mono/diheme cytochrome c family protein
MRVKWIWTGSIVMWMVAVAAIAQPAARSADQGGWILPSGAAAEKSPLTVTDATITAGHKLFTSKCQRCHGAAGKGDGEDANPKYRQDMDLTKADDVADNPDGVVFYKIWNGRSSPRMPAFSEQINKEQAWTIVAYVQTLRPKH